MKDSARAHRAVSSCFGPPAGPLERNWPKSAADRKEAGESEAAVPVLMDLKRIIINEINDQQIIVLREADGDRSFPIVIGMFEAISIDRRVKGTQWPRPMTHDLL